MFNLNRRSMLVVEGGYSFLRIDPKSNFNVKDDANWN